MTDITRYDTCPPWCVTEHGTLAGEEDNLHTGADLHLVEGLTARLTSFVNPDTGVTDGPSIIVGSTEWTPQRTRRMAKALLALADAAARSADTMSYERDSGQ